ncbi:hypothetical protein GE21DRAFT_1008572 [Neurospora crassa]|nr:hypothetical protein GE21DRAFT_1008572 [Neurospora crassa]
MLVQRLQRRSVVGKAVVSAEIGCDCRGHEDKRQVIQLAVSCGSKQPGDMSGRSGVRSDLPESSISPDGTTRARRRRQTAQDGQLSAGKETIGSLLALRLLLWLRCRGATFHTPRGIAINSCPPIRPSSGCSPSRAVLRERCSRFSTQSRSVSWRTHGTSKRETWMSGMR